MLKLADIDVYELVDALGMERRKPAKRPRPGGPLYPSGQLGITHGQKPDDCATRPLYFRSQRKTGRLPLRIIRAESDPLLTPNRHDDALRCGSDAG